VSAGAGSVRLVPRVVVLMPTRGSVTAETLVALVNNTEGYELVLRTENRQPVDVARNRLAATALAVAADRALFDEGDDPFVFWIDSDAFFLPGTLTMLIRELQQGPYDLLAPLSGARVAGSSVQALRDVYDRSSSPAPGVDCERGEIVPVAMSTTHFLAHRASLLARVGPEPFGTGDAGDETEDFFFCRRVREAGGRIAVHTGVPVFHVDERNGAAYLPQFEPIAIVGSGIDANVPVEALPLEQRSYGPRIDAIVKRTPR
jgi:hypothetical protein